MKYPNLCVTILILFLIPKSTQGQKSLVDLMTMFSSSNKATFINENHSSVSYVKIIDEEEKTDTTLVIDGESIAFKILSTKKHEWNGLELKSTTPLSNYKMIEIFEFDTKSNIIRSETLNSGSEGVEKLNEKMLFTYDDKNRLKHIRFIKENMSVDKTVFQAEYGYETLLPTNADIDLVLKMNINQEPIKDGFKYIFKIEIPQDLIEMIKEELGPNASDAEVKAALGPLGKVPKKYSNVTFAQDGSIKEEVYDENKENTEKMDLTSVIYFDKNFNILNRTDYQDGQISSSNLYEYTDKQKVKSLQIGDGPKLINEFDAQGNMIKEYYEHGYYTRIYNNGRLSEEREYSNYSGLVGLTFYKY
ncbi:MAG TPA: hypothetical protein PKD16_18980 [Saprospiraceae bacterium]|jgi:hypothetical protein|nr:hypothetical protein [Saprospiraceae bacterium]HMT72257.1 hypothetical protein [Saprospiraceae bacterium]